MFLSHSFTTTLDWSAVTARTLYLSLPANNPASGEPTISGIAQVGQMLTAGTSAIMDADGVAGVTFSYQWIREDDDGTNPVDITGATPSTYTLTTADVGKKVKVRVSFEDNLHSPESVPESRAEMLTSAAYPPAGTVAVDPATAPPQLAATDGAVVNGATLVLTYNEALDEGSTPATGAYTVMVAGTTRAVSTVMVSGTTVTLTLASAVTTSQTVTVSYTPGTNPVQDTGGADAAALTNHAVTNNTGDTTAPALATTNPAVVNGATLVLTYDEALDPDSTPATSAYTVMVAGTARAVSTVMVSGRTVTLTLASAVTHGQAMTVSYVPGTNPVQDTVGNDAAALTDQAVTNNTLDTTAPALATTNPAVVSGDTLVLTYNEALDSGSTPAPDAYTVTVAGAARAVSNVAVSGTTVTLTLASAVTPGQTVTVSYTPGTNPVQDTSGNAAPALTNRAVTNNTGVDNTAPTRDNMIPDQTAVVGTEFTYQVPDNIFSDADGDPLAYAATQADGTALPAWLDFTAASRTFTGTPQVGDIGTLSVKVTASDGQAGNDPAEDIFDITVNATATGVPIAPTKPTLVSATTTSLTVAWTHPASGSSPLIRNFVQYREQGTSNWMNHNTGGSPVTQTTIPNLEPNTRYQVRVAVTNTAGGSGWSETSEPFMTESGDAGVTLTGTENLSTTEAGGTASFEVMLNTQPSANVTVTPSSSDATEGTVSDALTFTATNWNTAQTVTVTGVDDTLEDGDRTYRIRFTVSSTDGAYNGITVPAVSVINEDDETATDTTPPRLLHGHLWVDQATLTLTFDEALDEESVPDKADFEVYATTRRYSVGPRVPVGGVAVDKRTVVLTLQRPVQGADWVHFAFDFNNSGIPLKDTTGNELWVEGIFGVDNRTVTVEEPVSPTPGVTLVGASNLRTSEARGKTSFYVVLNTRPSAKVRVRVSSSDETEGRVTTEGQYAGRLDFTTRGWNLRRKVILTGVDDTALDGDQAYEIRFEVSSADTDYDGIEVRAVPVINADDDSANASPTVAKPLPDVVATERAAFRHTVAADAFADADGDGLTYTAALQGGGALPAWLRFIPATRTFTGTPPPAAAGQTLSVEVTANDGNGGTATDTFKLSVVRAAPPTVAALKSLEIDGDTLTMAFNRTLDAASRPSRAHFTVTVRYETGDSGSFGVSTIPADKAWVRNGNVVVRLAGSVKFGYEVRLDYDPSRTNIGRHTYDADATPIMFSDTTKPTTLPAFANRAVANKTWLSLSVADAAGREGWSKTLRFNVRLDAPGVKTVTVDYATVDGTAVAGRDYTAASGTLTFAPGERKKTIIVESIRDAHDEGDETLTLRLSNPVGARISDGEAIGTIINSGPMPGAWVARLGRVLGSQVVEAVSARVDGGLSGSHLNVGGVSLIGGGTALDAVEPLTPGDWLARQMAEGPQAPRPQERTLTERDLLMGSSFHLVSQAGEDGGSVWSAWAGWAATASVPKWTA